MIRIEKTEIRTEGGMYFDGEGVLHNTHKQTCRVNCGQLDALEAERDDAIALAESYFEQAKAIKAERDALLAAQMTEEKARDVLGDSITQMGFIVNADPAIYYKPKGKTASTEGDFTALQLKAIAWWMENKGEAR